MAITGRSIPNVPILVRGSLVDPPTPGPIVATTRPKPPPGVATLIRSSLVDAIAPATMLPAQPLVVLPARPAPRTAAVLLLWTPLEGVEPTDCKVHRPNTGTVARGSTGTIGRPNTGVVEFCTCCT